jgi:hypothetical protein
LSTGMKDRTRPMPASQEGYGDVISDCVAIKRTTDNTGTSHLS